MVTCPYCNCELLKPPKRAGACPGCAERVYSLGGGTYGTEEEYEVEREELAELKAVERRKKRNSHGSYRRQVLRELKSDRKSGCVIGIKILGHPGTCPFCTSMTGRTFSLDEAIADERLRPPFEECTNEMCLCSYTSVLKPLDQLP